MVRISAVSPFSYMRNGVDLIASFIGCNLALDKTPAEDEKLEADDNARTIRPGRSPGLGTVPLPLAKAPEPQIAPIAEDYSDLVFEEDEAKLEEKVADFKVCSSRLVFANMSSLSDS